MRFGEIVRFEITYRMRLLSTWIYFIVFFALAFVMVDGIMIQEAQASSNVSGVMHANAPGLIAMATIAMSMIGMVATAGIFGDAGARDFQSQLHPLFFTTPISRADYLGGRFLGAFVINALLLVTAPLGLLIGLQMSEVEPELLGPFRLGSYIQPYLVFLLPNLFTTGAILFAASMLSRRALASFIAGLFLFFGSAATMELTTEYSTARKAAALLDPFGFASFGELITYWTPVEQNTLPVGLEGVLLWNRLIWGVFAVGVLAFVYFRFRFANEREGRRRRHDLNITGVVRERNTPVVVPQVRQAFGLGVRIQQMIAVIRRSFGEIVANRYLTLFLSVSAAFIFINGWNAWVILDTPTWPVTYVVTQRVLGMLQPIIYFLLAIYAGELIWRERETGASEITDAAPLPNWVSLAGKFGALVLSILLLQVVLMIGGILLQALQGYYEFEIGLYLQILFGLQLIDYVLWGALVMLVHVLIDQKYLGHVIIVLYYLLSRFGVYYFGIENNMVVYGAAPGWAYSDISGFGPSLSAYLWFKAFWGAWALLFAVMANLFWRRGREGGFGYRIREARRRLSLPTLVSILSAGLLLLMTGGFVFYNTQVLNDYRSRDERNTFSAEYEQLYKQYERIPQPRLVGSTLRVEIYPEQRMAELAGTYLLRNRTTEPIDSVHLMVSPGVEIRDMTLDRASERVHDNPTYGYRIFELEEPLEPGDSLHLRFDLSFAARGFTNHGSSMAVVQNGTYFDHDWLPRIGYQPEFELKGARSRREQGLAPRAQPPSVYDPEARWRSPVNTEWFHSEIVVGTTEDQIAIAPGALRNSWRENGRRYFHYVTDAPIKNVYAFLSADYSVKEDRWNDVEIQILHHPAHTHNLDRMVRGVQASLDYYTKHFGPYPYGYLRIAEVPRHAGTFARAFPGLVAYSEGFGFLARAEDGIDYPFAVTAHEVAHQWWGGQYAPADARGSRVLYETLAHYSALMVMETTYGREQVDQLLDLMMHRYLIGRQNSRDTEVPLLLSNDEKFIHYDKGAVVMYTLRDYLGEEQVNTALRRLLDTYRFGGSPYPTSLDLYQELQAVTPDSLQYLLKDLFEEITVWELQTNEVRVEPTGTGEYRVTLEVDAQKMKADSVGRVVPVSMDDLVYIGVFTAEESEDERSEPLYLQMHRIHSGTQTITVTVPEEPARAGIDPYQRLIDRKRENNVKTVSSGRGSTRGSDREEP